MFSYVIRFKRFGIQGRKIERIFERCQRRAAVESNCEEVRGLLDAANSLGRRFTSLQVDVLLFTHLQRRYREALAAADPASKPANK